MTISSQDFLWLIEFIFTANGLPADFFLVNCNKKTKVLTPRHLYCSIALFKPFVSSCLDGRVVNNTVFLLKIFIIIFIKIKIVYQY